MGAVEFNRQFILIDFTDLDNPEYLAFTRSPEFSTYLMMRRFVWRSSRPHHMGLHALYAKGALACSLERETIAEKLGVSVQSVSADISRLKERKVIEITRTGRQNIYLLGRWMEENGARYEHFFLDRLYIHPREDAPNDVSTRHQENLISDVAGKRYQENLISDDNHARQSDGQDSLHMNIEGNRETNTEDFEDSNSLYVSGKSEDVISGFMRDFAAEFRDEAPIRSSTTRATKLLERSRHSEADFIKALYKAREITKRRLPTVRKRSEATGAKSAMAYFFSVLEDVVGDNDRRDASALHNSGSNWKPFNSIAPTAGQVWEFAKMELQSVGDADSRLNGTELVRRDGDELVVSSTSAESAAWLNDRLAVKAGQLLSRIGGEQVSVLFEGPSDTSGTRRKQ